MAQLAVALVMGALLATDSAASLAEAEPNDEVATATAVTAAGTRLGAAFPPEGAGALVSGRLEPGDVDVFAFDLAEGDLLTVEVRADDRDAPFDPIVRILPPAGAPTDDDDEGPVFQAATQRAVAAGEAGRWAVAVGGFPDAELDGADSGRTHEEEGDYHLILGVTEDPAAFVEGGGDNDAPATAGPLPLSGGTIPVAAPGGVAAVRGSLDANDVDYWSVAIDGPGQLFVGVFDDAGGAFNDPQVRILDGSNAPIATDDDDGPSFLSATRATATAADDWTVAVTGFGDDDFDGGHGEAFGYTLVVAFAGEAGRVCDVDGDGDVDVNDTDLIFGALGQPASGPTDPRDKDGDGTITILDARQCVLECDEPECAEPLPAALPPEQVQEEPEPAPAPGAHKGLIACGLIGPELLLPLLASRRFRRRFGPNRSPR